MTDPITTASNPRVGEDVGRGNVLPSWVADMQPTLSRSGNDITLSYCNPNDAAYTFAEMERFFGASAFASAPSPEAGAGGVLGELDDVQAALKDCSEAVAFFDQVKRSTQAEQIAVGADHWNWLEAACRRTADVHRSGKLVAFTGSEEETKGEPSGTGSREPGPAVPASGFDPSREWQPISTAPTEKGPLFLLFEPHSVGGFQFVGCRGLDGEWYNNLDHVKQKPTYWRLLPEYPPSVRDRSSEAAETSGSAVGKSPADLSATPEATPKSSPSQTLVDPQTDRDAINFALTIDDHYDRLEFLQSWIKGDLSEWPEFRTLQAGGEVR